MSVSFQDRGTLKPGVKPFIPPILSENVSYTGPERKHHDLQEETQAVRRGGCNT